MSNPPNTEWLAAALRAVLKARIEGRMGYQQAEAQGFEYIRTGHNPMLQVGVAPLGLMDHKALQDADMCLGIFMAFNREDQLREYIIVDWSKIK